MKVKDILLNNEWVNQEIKEVNTCKKMKMKMKHDSPKLLGCSEHGHKRAVYSYPGLPQDARKISKTQPNLTPERDRKGTANKSQGQQR